MSKQVVALKQAHVDSIIESEKRIEELEKENAKLKEEVLSLLKAITATSRTLHSAIAGETK